MKLPITVEVVGDTSTWVHLVDADGRAFATVDSMAIAERIADFLNAKEVS